MNCIKFRIVIAFFIAFLGILPLYAQILKPFESSGKYGFTDNMGRAVIPAQYDYVGYFKDGLSIVGQNGKCGFIDKTGNIVIPIKFEEIFNFKQDDEDEDKYFEEGWAIIKQNGKYGFIDKTGKIEIAAQFDDVVPFSEGLARVEQNGKFGYIDETGKLIIPAEYDSAVQVFSEGLAGVELNGKYGFIDKTGKIVIPIQYDEALPFFSERLSRVKKNGKYGLIDKTGRIVIPIEFDGIFNVADEWTYNCEYFREGLAIVEQNGKCGFINKTGKFVIPARFDYADTFSEGLARVKQNGKWGIIDKTGHFVTPPKFDMIDTSFSEGAAVVQQNGKYGFIDKTGNVVVPTQFDWAYPFTEGFAMVQQNKKWGFIDKTWKIIVPIQFDVADDFSEGLASVKKNDKWGFIDKTGKIVIPLQYDYASCFSEGLAGVDLNGKYGFIDRTGEIIIPAQFDGGGDFYEGLARVMQSDNIYDPIFYIDQQGRRYSTWEEGKDYLAKEAAKTPFQAHNTRIQSTVQAVPDTGYADRMVDVDSDIPQAKGANFGTYAVVIANENYRSVADVGNAANDGNVLHQYLTKTLGIPENNVIYCENASAAMMDEALTTLETKTRSAAALGKAFNVIFYYSGHGVPAEGTSDAYLLPVDVSPKNLKRYGFSLDELYRRLGSLEAQCVTVLLDACFSGAGRSGAMLADVKGVALEPKKAAPTGNMVVLSACSGSQTAHIFKEGKHGLFTYWLLRKLKETKGEVTLGELQEHLAQYVDYTATNRLNLPGQQPTLQVSPTLSRNWRAIPLR